jgi:hypothetical protein
LRLWLTYPPGRKALHNFTARRTSVKEQQYREQRNTRSLGGKPTGISRRLAVETQYFASRR